MASNEESKTTWLDCACCGKAFKGWQHWDRDHGYGICDDAYCSTSYGYHTVGPKPDKAGYEKLKEEIRSIIVAASKEGRTSI